LPEDLTPDGVKGCLLFPSYEDYKYSIPPGLVKIIPVRE
jgi:hypothetical protein